MPAPTDPQFQQYRGSFRDYLFTAIRFLTIIPVPTAWAGRDHSPGPAIPFFPLVGTLIGMLLVLVGLATDWLWSGTLRAVATVVVWGGVTGGLHLDGLSDTFDGVMSWRPRERKLEIMRDSRMGVMGALALAAVLGLKVALLSQGDAWAPALLLASTFGRWAMCYGLCCFPPARADGLGAMVQTQSGSGALRRATIVAVALGLMVGGPRGLLALLLVWLAARGLARWWSRDLGGLTGDTYGALCEISEVVALAALTARVH